MSDVAPIRFTARVLRKAPTLPHYIVVHPSHVPGRQAAFSAEVTLNDAGPFARTIRPWGKGSAVFFFNLTAKHCAAAGIDTGDEVRITIRHRA